MAELTRLSDAVPELVHAGDSTQVHSGGGAAGMREARRDPERM